MIQYTILHNAVSFKRACSLTKDSLLEIKSACYDLYKYFVWHSYHFQRIQLPISGIFNEEKLKTLYWFGA